MLLKKLGVALLQLRVIADHFRAKLSFAENLFFVMDQSRYRQRCLGDNQCQWCENQKFAQIHTPVFVIVLLVLELLVLWHFIHDSIQLSHAIRFYTRKANHRSGVLVEKLYCTQSSRVEGVKSPWVASV